MKIIQNYLEDYNAVTSKQMNLVLFQFAVHHISRICRVIKQPGGNALLVGVGGSGRQSLARLAAFIQGFEVFQVRKCSIKVLAVFFRMHVCNFHLLIITGRNSKEL